MTSRWTPETDARLRGLLAAGMTSGQAALALGPGFTRNMVISRAKRIGAKLLTPQYANLRSAPKPRQHRVISLHGGQTVPQYGTMARRAPEKPVEADEHPAPRLVPETTPSPASAEQGPVRMADLRAPGVPGGQCRWVIGEPKGLDTLFCAQPSVGDTSWCKTHFAVVSAPLRSRKAS